nr:Estrogen regulated protein EP45 [Hymenolepis microstoma]
MVVVVERSCVQSSFQKVYKFRPVYLLEFPQYLVWHFGCYGFGVDGNASNEWFVTRSRIFDYCALCELADVARNQEQVSSCSGSIVLKTNACIKNGLIISDVGLYVSVTKQVAMMEVNETGVKAAVVSGLNVMPMSLPSPANPFHVDQPFYCAIYESQLDLPPFIAHIVDPR